MEQWLRRTSRRGFIVASWSAAATLVIPRARGNNSADPWSKAESMEPSELVKMFKSEAALPHIYCVAFPVLYRQRHISHATFAGPASKPAGIAALRAAVAGLPKDSSIVIYCGCCPMKDCPNIRPAYQTLKELGFRNLRVLDLPTNLRTDWVAKGYPVA